MNQAINKQSTIFENQTMLNNLDSTVNIEKNELEKISQDIDMVKISEIKSKLDFSNSNSILTFGSEAQMGLTQHSDAMINNSKNKDVGVAGEVLNNLMLDIRGLKADDIKNPNFIEKIIASFFNIATPIQKFIQRYESVNSQINSTVSAIETQKNKLSNDIKMLDNMYEEAKKYFFEITAYIKAGEIIIDEKKIELKNIQSSVEKIEDSSNQIMEQSEAKDFADRIADIERRVEDMKLTRSVTLQMLPIIRMTQDVDKGLVSKMITICVNTIPLWKQQIAMAIAQENQRKATHLIKSANDTTNDLLRKNAEMLKQNTMEAKKEIERGIIDIETIKITNKALVETINESVNITIQAREARKQTGVEMDKCQEEIRKTLQEASIKMSQ